MKHPILTFKTLSVILLLFGAAALFQQAPNTTTLKPANRADRLLRELPDAAPVRRLEIVTELHSLATTKTTDSSFHLHQFGYAVTTNDDGTTTLKPQPDRNKVLGRAIPVLIDMIDDTEWVSSKPWWILISLQGWCPEPKKSTWLRWWKETGSKTFTVDDQ